LHFTPTSGSWLKLVEVFFGIITRQAIRRGTFRSVADLVAEIGRLITAAVATTLDAATTSTATTPAPTEASALEPSVEVPVTVDDLLGGSHPLSVQEELAAAQATAGTVPLGAVRSYELTSTPKSDVVKQANAVFHLWLAGCFSLGLLGPGRPRPGCLLRNGHLLRTFTSRISAF
jgi:hypothetical protein